MRKIRLSDTDLEFFDMEVSPSEFMFFQKHKEAFRCMWKEQGKPFWTRFTITFRSFTVKHGVIKQMSCDSPKFENLLDQAFIFIHEQYVDGKEGSARIFVEDIARLAQNHDKFPNLDSKSFSKDPFYLRETRDLFRRFFGSPDQKSSYLKVYVLSPIYLRFGGSICRCLKKWMDAPLQDAKDESYWIPPTPVNNTPSDRKCSKVLMCTNCLDDCGTKYFRKKLCGQSNGPRFVDYWNIGDPRFNDKKNPLYNSQADRASDWRENLSVEDFRDFLHYAKFKYGTDDDKCIECLSLLDNHKIHFCKGSQCVLEKKKKKKKKKKEKADSAENKNDEEIQKLVDHINGKVTLDKMPSTTKAGASEIADDNTKKDTEEKKKKKRIFTKQAKITDDFKYGILSGAEDLKKHNVVGGFKVTRIEDEKTSASEITITVAALKGEEPDRTPQINPKDLETAQNMFPLNAAMIRSKIDNLPDKMEWWEGKGWCACVLDYEVEERAVCKHPTNFTIKISGQNEDSIKRTMFKLLFYVSKRKKRPCPGWSMDDDDVVACILPDDAPDQEGLTICIQKGFRFEERLTEEEKKSLQKPYDPCQPKKKKVLMCLDGKDAQMLKGEKGRESLKELLARISGDPLDDEDEQISLNDGSTIHLSKGSPPIVDIRGAQLKDSPMQQKNMPIDEGPLWDQMQKNPDKFELFVMVDKDKVPELRKHGLKPVDLASFKEGMEAKRKKCKNCGAMMVNCKCDNDSRIKRLAQLSITEISQMGDIELIEAEATITVTTPHSDRLALRDTSDESDDEDLIDDELADDICVGIRRCFGYLAHGDSSIECPVPMKEDIMKCILENRGEIIVHRDDIDAAMKKRAEIDGDTGAASESVTPDENIYSPSKSFKPKIQLELSDTESESMQVEKEENMELETSPSEKEKKSDVFKFTAESDEKIVTKSPVKNGPKSSKSTKSAVTGNVNFSIPTDGLPEKLKLNLNDDNIPNGKDKVKDSEEDNNSATTTSDDDKDDNKAEIDLKTDSTAATVENGDEGSEIKDDSTKLRRCAKCEKEEPTFKTYKKCQKCKLEGILNARYYCGRECQIADWTEKHKKEHKENLLD